MGSRKYRPCNYYSYIPVDRIMNISDCKSSNLNYFSGIFSSQCPHEAYACFYKIEVFTYSFSYLILYYNDLDKERVQNDKEMFKEVINNVPRSMLLTIKVVT